MVLKLNLQRQVLQNMQNIANLLTTTSNLTTNLTSLTNRVSTNEGNISNLSQRVVNTETDILDLSLRTLKRSVLPLSAPQIVSLATDGTQVNLTLGTNLSITNGVLNAAGGGGDLSNYYTKQEVNGLLDEKTNKNPNPDTYPRALTSRLLDGAYTETYQRISHLADGSTLAARDASGHLATTSPTQSYHAVNKDYVDGLIGDINSVLDSINGVVI